MPADFAYEFAELCQETVVWRKLLTRDSFAKPVYDDPVVFSPFTSPGLGGRRFYRRTRKVSSGGATPAGGAVDYIQTSEIWILDVPEIGPDDLVYIDGDDVDRLPPILSIEQPTDEPGEKVYTQVCLGSAVCCGGSRAASTRTGPSHGSFR